MEKWITRVVAALIALGAYGLFWTFGMFTAVPVQQGRLTAMTGTELQLIVIPLLAGMGVVWGSIHLFSLADRETSPRLYAAIRVIVLLGAVAAAGVGASWSLARVVG